MDERDKLLGYRYVEPSAPPARIVEGQVVEPFQIIHADDASYQGGVVYVNDQQGNSVAYGNKLDGERILQDDKIAVNIANLVAVRQAADINRRVRMSNTDNVDDLSIKSANAPVARTISPTLAPANTTTSSGRGYNISDYKSIYEQGGSGYQMSEYRSIYDE